jgi:hypothetical protein
VIDALHAVFEVAPMPMTPERLARHPHRRRRATYAAPFQHYRATTLAEAHQR